MTIVRCGNVECPIRPAFAGESPSTAEADRQPCPVCGSTARRFDVVIEDTVHVTDALHRATSTLTIGGPAVGKAAAALQATAMPTASAALSTPVPYVDQEHVVTISFLRLENDNDLDPTTLVRATDPRTGDLLAIAAAPTPGEAVNAVLDAISPEWSSANERNWDPPKRLDDLL